MNNLRICNYKAITVTLEVLQGVKVGAKGQMGPKWPFLKSKKSGIFWMKFVFLMPDMDSPLNFTSKKGTEHAQFKLSQKCKEWQKNDTKI